MLRPRIASSMHSPRRILIVLAGLLSFGYFITHLHFPLSPGDLEPDFLLAPSVVPPRPTYPPFQPPPVKEYAKQQEKPAESQVPLWPERAESIKKTFLRAYSAYEELAPFPNDELLPVSGKSIIKYVMILNHTLLCSCTISPVSTAGVLLW